MSGQTNWLITQVVLGTPNGAKKLDVEFLKSNSCFYVISQIALSDTVIHRDLITAQVLRMVLCEWSPCLNCGDFGMLEPSTGVVALCAGWSFSDGDNNTGLLILSSVNHKVANFANFSIWVVCKRLWWTNQSVYMYLFSIYYVEYSAMQSNHQSQSLLSWQRTLNLIFC